MRSTPTPGPVASRARASSFGLPLPLVFAARDPTTRHRAHISKNVSKRSVSKRPSTLLHAMVNNLPTMQARPDSTTLFRVLSDPTRRGIIELLGRGPRRAGELSSALAMSPPALSRHLRVLLEEGIVSDARAPGDARARVFRLRPRSLHGLRAWLDELEQHW